MRNAASFISPLINLIIIYSIAKIVTNAIKKGKKMNQNENKDKYDNFLDKEMQNINPAKVNPVGQKIIRNTPPAENKLIYENKLTDKDKLQLKRCSNCGGEIPLTMMKCTICGTRQAGCSWIFIVLIMFIAMFFAMIATTKSSNLPIMDYIRQIFSF